MSGAEGSVALTVCTMRPLEGENALDRSTPLFLNHPDPRAIEGRRRPGAAQT